MATAPNWEQIGGGIPLFSLKKQRDYERLRNNANIAGTPEYQAVQKLGSVDAVINKVNQYNTQYAQYLADFYGDIAKKAADSPTATDTYKASSAAQAEQAQSAIQAEQDRQASVKQAEIDARNQNVSNIRSQLENQYNNLVQLDPNAAYRGRESDLSAIFNQQAAQLADAGVTSITNLKIQDGKLVDSSTGKTVSTSNLGGQVSVDRDTGVQKWGDIFSGVEGGANYGIQALEDGSVVLFPAWEKSKSLTSQVLGSDLFKVASLALAGYGLYNLGTTLASAGGASTVAAAGSGLTPGAAGVTGLTPGAAGVTGLVAPAGTTLAPGVGATVAGTAGATGGYGLLDTTDFSRVGETGLIPGAAGEGIQVVVPPGGGAATIPGLEAPGLSAMGGAQGITVPIQGGGVVSEMGFVPPGATPSLGDPSSFINNPDYLGSPVISEDLLAAPSAAAAAAGGMSLTQGLMAASLLGGLGQKPQMGMFGGGGGGQTAGVDYSNLLSLLQGRARTPGVSPLIGPVVDPYQSLLGQPTQYQSLLG